MGGKKHQEDTATIMFDKICKQKNKVVQDIVRIRQSIMDKTISFNATELECRLDILKSYIDKAMALQSEIDELSPDNDDRAELEDVCVTTKSLFLQLLAKYRRPSGQEMSFYGQSAHHSRLPNMKLPKFSGKYSEYKNFMSLFENLVHNDLSLPDIEKFNHLISCLSDEALGTVRAFQVTEDNYPKALASLKKVYDNDCLIFSDNISKLFDLPSMNKPSATALRGMIDTVSAIYESLLSIGDDKKISNAIIIHLVMSKVDPITKSKWDEQLDFTKLPLWSDCESVLNKRYQHISADESSSSRPKHSNAKVDIPSKIKSSSTLHVSKTKSSELCSFCKSAQHSIYKCPSFAATSVLQRFDFIKSLPACINCLKQGHTVARCKSAKCTVCKGSHHSLLHRYTTNQFADSNSPSGHSGTSNTVAHAFA